MYPVVDEQSVEKRAVVGACFLKRLCQAQVVMAVEGTDREVSAQ